ncbi:MAG: lipopolysaccharide transport periplasmic protein LptA [Gammaproteobacteria bacterium]|nr:lipopolysaccharide transport periplasmic protein LptA [Gammaproteobacteria bacterium]
MSLRAASVLLVLALAGMLATGPADARRSDRNQPMDIDAGRQEGSLDDSGPIVLSGGVVITQGTMHVESDRAEITLRGGDIQRVVLTGSPATMRQETDDGSPMTARGQRIDYNVADETMVITGDAHVEQPQGNMASQRIVYNMQTERVEAGGEGAGRVQMRIQPRAQREGGGD